jgi:insulysin
MQAMKEPFFSDLRTRQQTGYIVFSQAREIERHLFNLFGVQSNTHAVRDLLARFELFIEGYLQSISEDLTEERFETIRQTLINTLKDPAKDMGEMGELLQRLAFKYDADFNWVDKRVQGFKDLTYGELLNFAHEDLGRENKQRFAILLKGEIPGEGLLNYTAVPSLSHLRKLGIFKPSDNE